MATETLNREELINTIWQKKGKVSLVAKELGVSTRTVYNYANKWSTVQDALIHSQDDFMVSMVDLAEVKTYEATLKGQRWSITHILNNSPEAKRRGWGPKVQKEHTGADGKDLPTSTTNITINDWRKRRGDVSDTLALYDDDDE